MPSSTAKCQDELMQNRLQVARLDAYIVQVLHQCTVVISTEPWSVCQIRRDAGEWK